MSTPPFVAAVRTIVNAALKDVRVGMPARVESYDAATNSISAKPLVMENHRGEDNELQADSLPVIQDVPVAFPGTGPFAITWPLAVGDTVWLMFSTHSLDQWLQYGGEVDPKDERRFSLSDAVAIPGVRPFNAATSQVHASAMVVAASDLRLGSKDSNDPVARKSDLDRLKTAISGAAVLAGDGGATFKANILTALNTVPAFPQCSSKVKVD